MNTEKSKYPQIMEMIDATCRGNFARKLEIYLRKEAILSVISEEEDILDVGCGWGVLSVYLAGQGRKVTAVDGSQNELDWARQTMHQFKAPVTLQVCAAENLGFPDESFDLVIWEEVLEHLDEPLVALREGYRVLRCGGKIILSVPNLASLRAKIIKLLGKAELLYCPDHKQNFNQNSIRSLAEAAGFKVLFLTSDFIPIPKIPINFLLKTRKALAKRFPSLGHHLIVLAAKQ
jgi:2-polyprenyl-3-methyl-5-hydroxy-6-metoxy-1,4-benzoquinol methylase